MSERGSSGPIRRKRRRRGSGPRPVVRGEHEIPETGDVVEVWWGGDVRYYTARVLNYDGNSGKHEIHYLDDDMRESIDLDGEQWRFQGEFIRRGRKHAARGSGAASASGDAGASTEPDMEAVHPNVRRWIVKAGDEAHNIFKSCRAFLVKREKSTQPGQPLPNPGVVGNVVKHAIEVKQSVAKFLVSEKYKLSPQETVPIVLEIRARVIALGLSLTWRTPLLQTEALQILEQAKEITNRLENDPALAFIPRTPSNPPREQVENRADTI